MFHPAETLEDNNFQTDNNNGGDILNESILSINDSQIPRSKFLHKFYEISQVGMCIVDPEGRLIYVNPSLSTILGYSREELLKKNFSDFELQASLEEINRYVEEALATGVSRFQIGFYQKNGSLIESEISLTLLDVNNMKFFLACVHDITSEIHLKEILIDAEERYRTIFENTGTAMAIIEENTTISLINGEFEKIFGYSKSEIEGKKSWTELVETDELERLKFYHYQRRIDPDSVPKSYELRIVSKQGQVITILASVSMLPGTKKSIVSLLDLSEHKKLLEETKQVAEHLELQTQRMPIGLIIWDTEFKVHSWNPAAEKIFGFTANEALGCHPYEIIIPPEAKPHVDNIWRRLLDGDTTAHSVNENLTKDGRTITCKWSNTPLKTRDNGIIGVLSMVEDITEQTRLELEVGLMEEIALEISLSENFTSALNVALRKTCETTGWVFGEAWIKSPSDSHLECSTAYYSSIPELEKFRELSKKYTFLPDVGLPGRVWASKESLWIPDASKDPLYIRAPLALEFGLKAAVGVPITVKGEVISVMNFFLFEPRDKDEYFVRLINTISSTLGLLFQRKCAEDSLHQSYLKLQKTLKDTIQVLSSMVETRDPYTSGHQKKVSSLACAIGKEMGLPEDRVEGVRVGSLLHDLGKIGIPIEILSKPGRISDYEFNIIKSHSQSGYELLNQVDFPWPVAEMVLYHHERVNGSGYPHGLKDGEIPLEALILSVADTIEAMSSHRPYRPALGIDTALEEISNKKGILYDPDVVEACLRLFTERGFEF